MKKGTEKTAGIASALLAALAVACVAARLPAGFGQNTAVAAAGFILPYGAAEEYRSADEDDGSASSVPPASSARSSSAPQSSSSAPPSSSAGTPARKGKVEEMCINTGGTRYQNMWVRNSNANHTVDIGKELAKRPDIDIKKNAGPQVLIYHTHTTEAFEGVTRTTDKTKSVCAVGDRIAKQLEAAGIGVVHDTTYHDYPAYNGSYNRSIVTMKNNLKKYPSIQVTLDIHRDAMTRSDGTRLKPTAVIGGKKAAQVMIIAGCDDTGDLGFPDWEHNLRFALRLQQSVSGLYPNLARPLSFCPRRYNENVTHGSLLVEIGTDANTLDEALYTGELFGKSLAAALLQLQG